MFHNHNGYAQRLMQSIFSLCRILEKMSYREIRQSSVAQEGYFVKFDLFIPTAVGNSHYKDNLYVV